MYKRAQAAMEFLMTYGWAILVVLVVIGALAYFGVLSPQNLLPPKCELQMGLNCKDYTISQSGGIGAIPSGGIKFNLENGMGKGILISSIAAEGKSDLSNVACCVDYSTDLWITGKNGLHISSGEDSGSIDYLGNPINIAGPGAPKFGGGSEGIWLSCDIAGADCTAVLGAPGGDAIALDWVDQGKKKFDLTIVYYYDDSDVTYSHTMKGALMTTIES